MGNAKMSFELDAGKILAKLHRGACQTYPKMLFFNTGVTDDAKIAPEAVDKAKIGFDMEGGEYELGVIIDPELDVKLKNEVNPLEDADGEKTGGGDAEKDMAEGVPGKLKAYLDKNKKELAELDDKEWKALYDEFKTKHKGEKVPSEGEFRQSVEAEMKKQFGEEPDSEDEDSNIMDNKNEEPVNEEVEKPKDVRKMDPNQNGKDFDTMKAAAEILDPDSERAAEIAKNAPEDAKKAVEQNHDAVKKFMEVNMKNAAVYLQQYMKVFAGKDEAGKIKPEDIEVTYVPEKFADPYKNKKYDNYQIPAMTDEEVRQSKIEQLKKDPDAKEFTMKNMCFKIAYSLDIGK